MGAESRAKLHAKRCATAAHARTLLARSQVPLALFLALCLPKGRALPGRDGVTDDTVTEAVIVLGCGLGSLLSAWRQAQFPEAVLPPLASVAARDDALGVLPRLQSPPRPVDSHPHPSPLAPSPTHLQIGVLLRVFAVLAATLLSKVVFKQLTRRAVDAAADLVGWPPPPTRGNDHADGTSARERCARPRPYTPCYTPSPCYTAPSPCYGPSPCASHRKTRATLPHRATHTLGRCARLWSYALLACVVMDVTPALVNRTEA